MNGHCENQLLHGGSQTVQLDGGLLVITFAFAGLVVAHVFNRTINRFLVVVENEAGVVEDLAAFTQDEDRRVEVEFRTVGNSCVPTQTYSDFGQAWGLFRQTYVPAFLQRYGHFRFL